MDSAGWCQVIGDRGIIPTAAVGVTRLKSRMGIFMPIRLFNKHQSFYLEPYALCRAPFYYQPRIKYS